MGLSVPLAKSVAATFTIMWPTERWRTSAYAYFYSIRPSYASAAW